MAPASGDAPLGSQPPLQQQRRQRGVRRRITSVATEIDPGRGPVSVDVALNLRAPEACPIEGLRWLENLTPGAVADSKQQLLAEDGQVAEMHDAGIDPTLQLLHRVNPV